MDINQIRKENLRVMIDQAGGRQAFIAKTGKSDAQVSQLLGSTPSSRNIGNRLARELESICGYEEGFMDQPNTWYSVKKPGQQLMMKRTAIGRPDIEYRRSRHVPDEMDFSDYPTDSADTSTATQSSETENDLAQGLVSEPLDQDKKIVTTRRDPRAIHYRRKLEWDAKEIFSQVTIDATPFLFLPMLEVVPTQDGTKNPSGVTLFRNHEKMRPFDASSAPMQMRDSELLAYLRIEDKAMEPLINQGDLVVVGPDIDRLTSGLVYALQISDEIKVRRLFRRPNGNIRVVSDNPDYPEEEITKTELASVNIVGNVVWRQGRI